MNIALIIAVYKRHDLEKIVLDNYRKQSKKFGFDIIVAGSEGDVSKRLARGCHYIEVDNNPLSNKHNAMLTKAKELDVDGVVLMGSDDIVNDEYWEWVYNQSKDETRLLGLKDIYFYSTSSKQLGYWKGYRNGKQTAGAGRFFSRYILDRMNWKLWSDGVGKGLDSDCNQRLSSKGIREFLVKMEDIGAFLVDVKHTTSITNEAILYNCEPVKFEIMEKKTRATAKKVSELKTETKKQEVKHIYNADQVVKFESNGKSKHMPAGQVYKIDGAKANLLLSRGFGKVVD